MEFPHLGQQCSLSTCNQLDFLPFTCDACNSIFCKDHFEFSKHDCAKMKERDVRVPVCPLCNKPVPIPKGGNVDRVVSAHIDRDCQSDPAKKKRKAYSNRCCQPGCKQRELIPVTCSVCQQNYCIRHRHPQDHTCPGKKTSASNWPSSSHGSSAGASRKTQKQVTSRPQRTLMSSMGSELNRLRLERQQNQHTARSQQSTRQQQQMNEDEQLAMALQMSLKDQNPNMTQEEIDLELARHLQEEEAARLRRRTTHQHQQEQRNNQESSCSLM